MVLVLLPPSMDREEERCLLVKKRQEKQIQLALSKGRTSRDIFSVGDSVRVNNHIGGRWDKSGVIIEERATGTSSPPSSFIIRFVYSLFVQLGQ